MEEQRYEECGFINNRSRICTVSEVVKEIKFLYQLLMPMGLKVPLPIKIIVDNMGAIWFANNSSVSERTKHIDVRAHFI